MSSPNQLNQLIKKLKMLDSRYYTLVIATPGYRHLERENPTESLASIVSQKEMQSRAVNDAGKLLHLTAILLHRKTVLLQIESSLSGQDDIQAQKTRDSIRELYKAYERLIIQHNSFINEAKGEPNDTQALNGEPDTDLRLHPGDNGLYEHIMGFFEQEYHPGADTLSEPRPLNEYRQHDKYDFNQILFTILYEVYRRKTTATTVKAIAGKIDGISNKLGVAVTFMGSLMLQAEGKVELSQGNNDVIIEGATKKTG